VEHMFQPFMFLYSNF